MSKNSENLAKKMISRVRQIERERDILQNDLNNALKNIYDILNQGQVTDDIKNNLTQFLQQYDDTNNLIFDIQNNQRDNIQRKQTRFYEFDYNKAIRSELEGYAGLVGWGSFSRVLRSENPREVWLSFQPGHEYEILLQLLSIYGPYLIDDPESAPEPRAAYSNNAYIIDKLTTAFESWISWLERNELIKV